MIERLPQRFIDKILVAGEGCWLWTGRLTEQGYAQVRDGRSVRAAHRVIYELLIGPIPDGCELHHPESCPRHCVNVMDHLRPLSVPEHKRLHRPTHCRKGHELTPDNRMRNGSRGYKCRTCHYEWQRKRRAAEKERQK